MFPQLPNLALVLSDCVMNEQMNEHGLGNEDFIGNQGI